MDRIAVARENRDPRWTGRQLHGKIATHGGPGRSCTEKSRPAVDRTAVARKNRDLPPAGRFEKRRFSIFDAATGISDATPTPAAVGVGKNLEKAGPTAARTSKISENRARAAVGPDFFWKMEVRRPSVALGRVKIRQNYRGTVWRARSFAFALRSARTPGARARRDRPLCRRRCLRPQPWLPTAW